MFLWDIYFLTIGINFDDWNNSQNRYLLLNLSILNGPKEGAVRGREVEGKGVNFIFHYVTQ